MLNLTFHGIGEAPGPPRAEEREFWLPPRTFEAILDAVGSRRDVRITFDDGNASDVEVALPILSERGLTATFFVVAGRLGEPGRLSGGDVHRLVDAGMSIGSHGLRHRPWRALAEEELREELVHARRLLEEIARRPVTMAACPFGSYDRRVLRWLRDQGYERVFTSDGGRADPGAWLQPRSTLKAGDGPAAVERLLASRQTGVARLKLAAKRWR